MIPRQGGPGWDFPVVEGKSSTCRRQDGAMKIQEKRRVINIGEETQGTQFCQMWALAHHLHSRGAWYEISFNYNTHRQWQPSQLPQSTNPWRSVLLYLTREAPVSTHINSCKLLALPDLSSTWSDLHLFANMSSETHSSSLLFPEAYPQHTTHFYLTDSRT